MNEKGKKEFALRLKMLREAFSVSQLQLAEHIGVKQYYIAKWESGAYEPNPEIKNQIAEFFHVSPLWLGGEDTHIFNGIVFIPRTLMLPQKRMDFIVQRKAVEFICSDGAHPIMNIANENHKPDGMVVFLRKDELILFLPYVSFIRAPDRISLHKDIFSILLPSHKKHTEWEESKHWVGTPKSNIVLGLITLSANLLYKINPKTPIEVIEEILDISIPEKLITSYKESVQAVEESEPKKIEWVFDAVIKVGDYGTISREKAREIIMDIENKFNEQHEDQKIYFAELKQKKGKIK